MMIIDTIRPSVISVILFPSLEVPDPYPLTPKSVLYPHIIQQTDNENTQTYQLKSVTWSNANFS